MYKGFRCIVAWLSINESKDQQIREELEKRQTKGQIRQLSVLEEGTPLEERVSFQSYQMPNRLMRWLSEKHQDVHFSLEWARMDLSAHGSKGFFCGKTTWSDRTRAPSDIKEMAMEVIRDQSEDRYEKSFALSEKVRNSWANQRNGPSPYLHLTETIWEMLNDLRLDVEFAEYLTQLDDPLSEVRDRWLAEHPEDADPEVWLMRTRDMVTLSGELDQLIEKMQAEDMDEAQSETHSPMQEQSM